MNANLIPELPFKFKIDSETWTVIGTVFDTSGWVMYDIIKDRDTTTRCTVSAVTLLTELKCGYWKIIKEETEMKKIKTTDLKGFIANEHQPYTDYNKEIADWLTENAAQVDFTRHINPNCYIFTSRNGEFYSNYHHISCDVYYTNEEFKKWVGMTKKPTTKDKLASILNVEGQRALDYLKERYMNEGFTKADLKDGMVCTTRRGDKYIVQGDRMIREGGMYMLLEDINDDLTVDDYSGLDIVSVQQTITVFERVDEKKLAIQKELEFAKAKAERLAAHISVLESKLK